MFANATTNFARSSAQSLKPARIVSPKRRPRDAGRALSGLAVNLDDAIDDEERRLFPTIQQALFGIGRRA